MENFNEYDEFLDKGISSKNTLPKGEQGELATKEHHNVEHICNTGTKRVRPIKPKLTYLVTIKCHAMVHVTKAELDSVYAETVKKLGRADWSSIIGYEEDSKKRMHIHTFVVVHKEPFFEKLQKPGWSIHFSKSGFPRNLDGKAAINYILKESQTPNAIAQRFDGNRYQFINRFEVDNPSS